jgi:hypothetical protein
MYRAVPKPARPADTNQRGGDTNMTKRRAARAAMLTSCLVWVLASCQAIGNEEAQSTEQLLAAAGFHMKEATTPQQLANLKAMTQRKIVIHDQDGQTRYVYADAGGCKCVYVGSEQNYDEFQNLSVKQEIAQDNLDASMDWGMWGPWPVW